jgi:hypothetical protein
MAFRSIGRRLACINVFLQDGKIREEHYQAEASDALILQLNEQVCSWAADETCRAACRLSSWREASNSGHHQSRACLPLPNPLQLESLTLELLETRRSHVPPEQLAARERAQREAETRAAGAVKQARGADGMVPRLSCPLPSMPCLAQYTGGKYGPWKHPGHRSGVYVIAGKGAATRGGEVEEG